MEISVHSLLEGAKGATGTVAVIDVFRAFTTAAIALANGATGIVMVRTVEEALALREAGIGQICMGEVRGRAPDGFDFGNSPFEISSVDFSSQTIIQRTSAGTQGIVEAATKADRLYAASLGTAEATVRALLSGSPDHVSLVAMGRERVETNRRGRTLRDPSSESARRQAGRSRCYSSAHPGRWRSRSLS